MNYTIAGGYIEFRCAQYSGSLPFAISTAAVGKSALADDDAGMLYLRSPYFKAAVDRFGIFMNQGGGGQSFGYLFPVSLLDKANEQEYADMKEWQQDMMYIGYKKLLDYCHEGNKLYDKGNVVATLEGGESGGQELSYTHYTPINTIHSLRNCYLNVA